MTTSLTVVLIKTDFITCIFSTFFFSSFLICWSLVCRFFLYAYISKLNHVVELSMQVDSYIKFPNRSWWEGLKPWEIAPWHLIQRWKRAHIIFYSLLNRIKCLLCSEGRKRWIYFSQRLPVTVSKISYCSRFPLDWCQRLVQEARFQLRVSQSATFHTYPPQGLL